MRPIFFSIITCISIIVQTAETAFSQETTQSPWTIGGYLETYYVYDFNKPANNTRPGFIYSYNRSNEVNLNLGFIRGAYLTNKVRANLALMTGTYANANLATEPGVLKNIYEANAGVKLSSHKNLWIDAGIFSSHIGFESAVGKDCWNLTRSMLADNSPYYEAGAKISYITEDGRWFLSGSILNGWQRIQRVDGNSLPSFGSQVTFKPTSSITLNSSTFIGTDKPDSARQMRYFHNFYGIFQVTDTWGITIGFDHGIEEKNKTAGRGYNAWFSPVVIVRASLNKRFAVAARGEYYSDKNGVIISTAQPGGFRTSGFSMNLDYQLDPHAVWRIECRQLVSKSNIFTRDNHAVNDNTFLATALAVSF